MEINRVALNRSREIDKLTNTPQTRCWLAYLDFAVFFDVKSGSEWSFYGKTSYDCARF